jgi:hypothetical protein
VTAENVDKLQKFFLLLLVVFFSLPRRQSQAMPETRVTRNEQQILWHFKTCNNSCAFDARFLCRFFYYRVINQMKIYVSYEILPRERGATARRTRSRRKKGSETAELGKADHFNVAFRS